MTCLQIFTNLSSLRMINSIPVARAHPRSLRRKNNHIRVYEKEWNFQKLILITFAVRSRKLHEYIGKELSALPLNNFFSFHGCQ